MLRPDVASTPPRQVLRGSGVCAVKRVCVGAGVAAVCVVRQAQAVRGR